MTVNLEKIADQYERARTSFRLKCEATARNLLMMILSDDNLKEIYSATYRVKTMESLIGKYIRKKAELPEKQGDDYDIEKYRPMSGENFQTSSKGAKDILKTGFRIIREIRPKRFYNSDR